MAVAALSASPALAAKGGRNGASISVPDGVYAGTTVATVNPGGSDTRVRAKCFQNGGLVYEQRVKVDANNQATLTLGPTPSWSGGPANCTAEEGYYSTSFRWHTLATTTFNVSD